MSILFLFQVYLHLLDILYFCLSLRNQHIYIYIYINIDIGSYLELVSVLFYVVIYYFKLR